MLQGGKRRPSLIEHGARALSEASKDDGKEPMTTVNTALQALLSSLDARGYDFVAPTPSVSRRARELRLSAGTPLRAIFGWSQVFCRPDLDPAVFELAMSANVLEAVGDGFRSKVRVSRVGGALYLHSAFPANGEDAVFLGPDSYRFVRFIAQVTNGRTVKSIAEVGCGAGVGGLFAAALYPRARVDLGDVNTAALELAAVNAAHAGVLANLFRSDGMTALQGPYDLIVANPPYVAGATGKVYKDGGDMHGARVALDWSRQAISRLTPGGQFVLYSGSAILEGGVDALRLALEGLVAATPYQLTYEELDPDIFGGELRKPAYAGVERIAAVGATITRGATP